MGYEMTRAETHIFSFAEKETGKKERSTSYILSFKHSPFRD